MTAFQRINGELSAESVSLSRIAETFGTPCYVYSRAALTHSYHAFDSAFSEREHLVCYAVKANPNLAILNLFARLGAGFDIVSGGELQRVVAAGGNPGKVVFSGVGKSADEMRLALEAGILCFNVESESELLRLNQVAGSMGKSAPVSLRVNPDVDPKTHPYIFHRPQRQQVRHRLSGSSAFIPAGKHPAAYLHPGNRLPYRLTKSPKSRLLPMRSTKYWTSLTVSNRTALPCTTWTSAAESAFAIRMKHRPCRRNMQKPCWPGLATAATRSSSNPGAPWSATPVCCSPGWNT